jgi:hypothetical protein
VETCSHCGSTLPADASFCPSCGRRTNAPPDGRDVPIDVQYAEPRYFGLAPPVFVFGAAAALLVLGVVLLLTGAVALGVICVVIAVALLPAFLAGARRWPDTSLARMGLSAADRVRDEAGVAADSITTWSRASREVARVRKEQFRLRRERDAKIRELGVAVHADDPRAEELKAEARALDARIEANRRALERTLASARRRVRKGRASVASTEIIEPPVAEAGSDGAEPDQAAADEPLAREAPEVEADTKTEPRTEIAPKPKPARRRQTRSR